MGDHHYNISQAAAKAGVTVHQVRIYLDMGLVRPCAVTLGGYHLFNDRCVERLRLIAAATRAGLLLSQIGELVRALDTEDREALTSARRILKALVKERHRALRTVDLLIARACCKRGAPVPEASA